MKKTPTLQRRVHEAVKSGKLVRTKGTPAETMSDFELTRFLVDTTPDHDIEYYLMMADSGARVEVSGMPEVSQEDSGDLLEKLIGFVQQHGGRVGVSGEGPDGLPMDVTIYNKRNGLNHKPGGN